jgi:hypothetical protein
MKTPVISGREFNDRDSLSSPKVAIVNEKFASKFFGGANPVGHTFHLEASAGTPESLFEVVGMVRNTKYQQLREEFQPVAFFPLAQDENPSANATFMLRVSGTPNQLTKPTKAVIAGLNPLISFEAHDFSAELEETLLGERLMATLSGGFGLLAGLLAMLGLYGVISYLVARRQREFGLRMALGADRMGIIQIVLREAFLLLGLGVAAGILLALGAGKAAATLLFGLRPYDAGSLIAASVLLIFIGLVAAYLPARRAAMLDPTNALRTE